MQKEKVRIYILARELDMESKDLLDLCKQHGIDVKNQLSSVEPEMRDDIVALVKRGSSAAKPQQPTLARMPEPLKNLDSRPPVLPPARPRTQPEQPSTRTAGSPAEAVVSQPESHKTTVPTATMPQAPKKPADHLPSPPSSEPAPSVKHGEPITHAKPAEQPGARVPEKPGDAAPAKPSEMLAAPGTPEPPVTTTGTPSSQAPRPPVRPPVAAPPGQQGAGGGVRDLNQRRPAAGPGGGSAPPAGDRQSRNRTPPPPRHGGAGRIATPPTPSTAKPRPESKKPAPPTGPKKLMEIPHELAHKGGDANILDLIAGHQKPGKPVVPGVPGEVVAEDEDEEGGKDKKARRPGQVPGRDARRNERNARQQTRKTGSGAEVDLRRVQTLGVLEVDDQPRCAIAGPRRKRNRRAPSPARAGCPSRCPSPSAPSPKPSAWAKTSSWASS